MNALRISITTVILWGLIYLLSRTVVSGLRTGRIAHTDSASFCQRSKNPLGYWSLLVLFSIMDLGYTYIWIQIIHNAYYQ